jgi:hypothetical protein
LHYDITLALGAAGVNRVHHVLPIDTNAPADYRFVIQLQSNGSREIAGNILRLFMLP